MTTCRKIIPVSVDRVEGPLAVFTTEAGDEFHVPAAAFDLPPRPGDVYVIVHSPRATAAVKAEGRGLMDELRARDPGGKVGL